MNNDTREGIIELTQQIEDELKKAFSKLEENPKLYRTDKVLLSYYSLILSALTQLNRIIDKVN